MIWSLGFDDLLYYRRQCRQSIRDWLGFSSLDQSWMRRRRMVDVVWWSGELIRTNEKIREILWREMENDQN